MKFSQEHQRHAAACRHAPTRKSKELYFNRLNEKYETCNPQPTSIAQFYLRQRGQIKNICGSLSVKPRTAEAWLRSWLYQKQQTQNSNRGEK